MDPVMAAEAARHGRIWGARAAAWAEEEAAEAPKYEPAMARAGIGPGRAVLDVGCGSGVFLALAAGRGARVAGLDASEALIAIARERVPHADLRAGDMSRLPFADEAFDAVTGFNSFFLAPDMAAALREAARVARPGAAVVVQVWGRPERIGLTPMFAALRELRTAPAPAPSPPLWRPGALEDVAEAAGLAPEQAFDVAFALEYADEPALLRRLLSPGPVAELVEDAGEDAVAAAILESLAACRTRGGGYRIATEWRTLIARARPGVRPAPGT
ncbi:MAG TPA: class I SAM-dependent methyltransferase [Miltoncostaeaceae bacterium]|nr:class I SAM-dependent methyltransferase [Miltoncostaeaceae bacterium]